MKIALIHSFYRESIPSGENQAVRLQAKALAKAGHEVKIISRSTDDLVNRKFYALQTGLTVATGKGPSPLNAIREFQPDIVHVHNLFPNWSTDWVKHLDVPLVATVHNFRPVCSAGTLLRDGKFCDLCPTKGSHNAVIHSCYQGSRVSTIPIAIATRKSALNALLQRADRIIFLSPRAQAQYLSLGVVDPNKSTVIPNFIEPYPSAVQPTDPAREGGWIFVGRLSEEKGIIPLIRHWPEGDPLDVVGSGPQEGACRREAEGKAIKFHGQKSNQEVRSLLQNSRGLVFPSLCQESAPTLVYLEALAAGIPTIALAGNSVADDVVESAAGIAVGTLEHLPWALREVNERRKLHVRAAAHRFENTFHSEIWLECMSDLYGDLVHARK